jgi:hypothetical protein
MYADLLYIVYSGNKRYYTKLYGSSRFRDPLNQSTCKIEKTRTDQAGSKLTERNAGFFFSSSENQQLRLCASLSSKSSDRKCLVNIRDILKRYFFKADTDNYCKYL